MRRMDVIRPVDMGLAQKRHGAVAPLLVGGRERWDAQGRTWVRCDRWGRKNVLMDGFWEVVEWAPSRTDWGAITRIISEAYSGRLADTISASNALLRALGAKR